MPAQPASPSPLRELPHDLLEVLPDAALVATADGRVAAANALAERVFGHAPGALAGQPLASLVPPDHRVRHDAEFARYFSAPRRREFGPDAELRGLRADGSDFPLEITLGPGLWHGQPAALAIVRDATQRRIVHEHFRVLLASAPDAMVITDVHGTITLVNPQAERMFGYDHSELVGKSISLLIPERYRAAHAGHRSGYFRRPSVRPMGSGVQLLGLRRDGTEFSVEISLSPVETSEGVFACAAVRDISERKRVEMRLKEYADKLERTNRDLEQFAYVASHDLQSPLRSLVGFAQLLEQRCRGKLGTDADEYIRYIVSSAKHMQALVAGLLTFARVGQGGEGAVPVDCERVLARVETLMRGIIEERGAVITHDPLPRIVGSEMQLTQLFQNLISNAIKFQPGPAPRVHVAVRRTDGTWQFSVIDHGIGIPQEYREQIFRIFRRLHSPELYEGTGIGLSICKKIVHEHGGEIWVESEPGVGSRFHFTLPAQAAGAGEAGATPGGTSRPARPGAPAAPDPAPPPA